MFQSNRPLQDDCSYSSSCWFAYMYLLVDQLTDQLTDWLADLLIKIEIYFFRNLPTNWLGHLLSYWLCVHPLPLSWEVTSKSFTFVWQIHVDWLTDSHVSSDWLIGSLLEYLALLVVWNNGEMENKDMNKVRLGFVKSESFDHELPLKYWLKFPQDLNAFFNLHIYASHFCINCCV